MKTITMNYDEYKHDLAIEKHIGFNNALNEVKKAIKLLNDGNKKESFEMLWELFDYTNTERLEKLCGYKLPEEETPDFSEQDVPF